MYYRIVFDPVADGWLIQITSFTVWGLINRWATVKETARGGHKRDRIFDSYDQATNFFG